jgi:hypothetical protein
MFSDVNSKNPTTNTATIMPSAMIALKTLAIKDIIVELLFLARLYCSKAGGPGQENRGGIHRVGANREAPATPPCPSYEP